MRLLQGNACNKGARTANPFSKKKLSEKAPRVGLSDASNRPAAAGGILLKWQCRQLPRAAARPKAPPARKGCGAPHVRAQADRPAAASGAPAAAPAIR